VKVDKVEVTPGTTSIAIMASRLFGYDHVNAGSWNTPVYVHIYNLKNEDVRAGFSLMNEASVSNGFEELRFNGKTLEDFLKEI
jgi:uncharacterized protein (UPF0264 family)